MAITIAMATMAFSQEQPDPPKQDKQPPKFEKQRGGPKGPMFHRGEFDKGGKGMMWRGGNRPEKGKPHPCQCPCHKEGKNTVITVIIKNN